MPSETWAFVSPFKVHQNLEASPKTLWPSAAALQLESVVAVGGMKSKPWKAVPFVRERLRSWARLMFPVREALR